jgi:hypothetical protein
LRHVPTPRNRLNIATQTGSDVSMGHIPNRRIVKLAGLPVLAGLGALTLVLAVPAPSSAQRIENAVAVFAALDKVTAKISKLEVPLNETKSFGALKVTPRVCYTRAPTEPPKTTSFVEVDETLLDGKEKRLFSGWMFADSPGLNAVEHPVFDVWLTDCTQPRTVAPRAPQPGTTTPSARPTGPTEPPPFDPDRRRRPPR